MMLIYRGGTSAFSNIKIRGFCVSALNLSAKYKEISKHKTSINEAEKIVGYPTSFLSLRWLLNDEIANIASHLRKLVGTNHPLLTTARNMIVNKQTPTWGLVVLLISKAGGLKTEFADIDRDITAGILHSQRVLAEVTEMIKTSNILHKSILNTNQERLKESADLSFGNKLSLLSGDYLLSSSFKELAGLKNQEVNELISTCLRDLVEAEFIEPTDKQNRPLPAKPQKIQKDIAIPNEFGVSPLKIKEVLGNAKAEWTLRHFLGNASLLAKCCQGSLKLANHSEEYQKLGYLFGRNMALAWQAQNDLEHFTYDASGPFSLICAPLMFHLQHDPSFYETVIKAADRYDEFDFDGVRDVIKTGPGLEKTMELKEEFSIEALKALKDFPESSAKTALENIVKFL